MGKVISGVVSDSLVLEEDLDIGADVDGPSLDARSAAMLRFEGQVWAGGCNVGEKLLEEAGVL